MINFHIPDFYNFFKLNTILYDFMTNKYTTCFYDNIKIGSVYGSFPGAVWNGGRPAYGECHPDTIFYIIDWFNSRGIPLRFTFTNSFVNESHLEDEYCNFLMAVANNGMNEVIVNNEILEKYLREKYPNYKYILSTTSCITGADNINEKCKLYDYVVMEYNDNKKDSVLNAIDNKNKVEILINESCMPNCPYRQEHYKYISQQQLGLVGKEVFNCVSSTSTNFYDVLNNECKKANHFITPEELYNKYSPLGFENFKIQGRGLPMVYTLESYLTYMVKPEYKDLLRYEFLSEIEAQ